MSRKTTRIGYVDFTAPPRIEEYDSGGERTYYVMARAMSFGHSPREIPVYMFPDGYWRPDTFSASGEPYQTAAFASESEASVYLKKAMSSYDRYKAERSPDHRKAPGSRFLDDE